jgi:hypothetical protein
MIVSWIRSFIGFWIDFIVGDAWEVAAGVGAALVVAGLMAHRWGLQQAAGFLLLASVVGVTWLALLRATAGARQG